MAQESMAETLDSNDRSVSPNKTSSSSSDPSLSRNGSFSRLNAQAPEFVPSPRSSVARPDLAQPRLTGPSPPILHVVHVPIQHHMVNQQHHYRPHHVPSQYQHHGHQHHHQQQNHQNHNHHHRQQQHYQPVQTESDHGVASRNGLSDEAAQKIVNQVDYYFSDLNLATTDHLMRFISKDPEGYVPISIVAAFKKIKALISSNLQLATILRNSSKLLVSEDGKKVKRQHPFTESDMEELQSRIVIAENLPEDHCHQNLMKVFSAIGSVKAIRTCQPPTSNNGGGSSASRPGKGEGVLFSNKLHAFVEYETTELAEKAVEELNDEGNWRSGLRVRLMPKRGSKQPVQAPRTKKGQDGEEHCDEDDNPSPEQPAEKPLEDFTEQIDTDLHGQQNQMGEENGNEKDNNSGGQRKGRGGGRGRGRGGGRGRNNNHQYHHNNNNNQYHHSNNSNHNRGNNHHPIGASPVTASNHHHPATDSSPSVAKQPPGPRMPDGTRGFAMGRGKPVVVSSSV